MSEYLYLKNADLIYRFPQQSYICDLCERNCENDFTDLQNGCMNMITDTSLYALVNSQGVKVSKAMNEKESEILYNNSSNIIKRYF